MNKQILIFSSIALIVGAGIGALITQRKDTSNDTSSEMVNEVSYGNRNSNGNYRQDKSYNKDSGQGFSDNGLIKPNRKNCLADDCLMFEDVDYPVEDLPDEVIRALNEAINDEYKALSTYEAVIEKFGQVRPFSMIKGAEEQHISSLKAIYDKYGVEVPRNDYIGNVTVPSTLNEACQIGVDAEIANASLYKDVLLPAVVDYEDITLVFTNLMNASQQKHLVAFERCN